MSTNSVSVYKEKNKWAAPVFGPLTMTPITFGIILLLFDRSVPNLIIGFFIVGALGALGMWRLVDWKKETNLNRLWEENLQTALSSGYNKVVLSDGCYGAILMDNKREKVVIYELSEKGAKWYLKDTTFNYGDIQTIAIETNPKEFQVHSNLGKFTLAGTLLYGTAGFITGVALDEIINIFKDPKQIKFEVSILFRLGGNEQHTCHALRSTFSLTDSNRDELPSFFQNNVLKKTEEILTKINESFQDLLTKKAAET